MPIDSHILPAAHWGVAPYLLIGQWQLSAYTLLVGAGYLAGLLWYLVQWWRQRGTALAGQSGQGLIILVAAVGGSLVGAKLPMLLATGAADLGALLDSGRTIVGGLLGGMLAVFLVKKLLGIKARLGNHLAPGIALGIGIGRIGCFLAGCCHGRPTGIDGFGVDFGDGILRHPTQIYDGAWAILLFLVLVLARRRFSRPGLGFRFFVLCYMGMRFVLEFIRVEPVVFAGLTGFQIAALLAVLLSAWGLWRMRRQEAES